MTAVSDSTLGSAFSSLTSNAGGAALRGVVPAPIAALAGAAAAATVVGDVASATVTLSAEALSGLGNAVEHGVDDLGSAAKSGWNWLANGVESAATGAANFVVGAVELPFTIAADVGQAAEALVGDGVELVGKTIGGVASFAEEAGAKLIDAIV